MVILFHDSAGPASMLIRHGHCRKRCCGELSDFGNRVRGMKRGFPDRMRGRDFFGAKAANSGQARGGKVIATCVTKAQLACDIWQGGKVGSGTGAQGSCGRTGNRPEPALISGPDIRSRSNGLKPNFLRRLF
jgi:hypothetical protein